MNQSPSFELIFQGPADESPDTLRKLKGIFIAELEFTIEETIQALQKFPLTIKRAEDEHSLSRIFHLLESAGGKVLLVKPKEQDLPQPETVEETEKEISFGEGELWQTEDSSDKLVSIPEEHELAPIDLEFTAATNDASEELDFSAAITELKTPNVFQLDEDIDLADALRGAEEASLPSETTTSLPLSTPEISAPPELATPPPTSTSNELSFELLPNEPESAPVTESAPALPTITAQEFLLSALSLEETTDLHVTTEQKESQVESPSTPEPLTLDLTLESVVIPETPAHIPPPPDTSASFATEESSPALPYEQPVSLEESNSTSTPEATSEVASSIPIAPSVIEESTTNIAAAQIQESPSAVDSPPIPSDPLESDPTPLESAKVLGLPRDLVLPIAIGALLLGVANWWVFSATPDAPQISLASAFSPQVGTQDEAPPVARKAAQPPIGYVGSAEFLGMPCEVKLVGVSDKIRAIKISFTPAAPRELSPEEIVQGVLRDPWAKRVDVEDLRLTNLPDGSFEGSGPARIVIEDQVAKRYITQIKVTGRWSKDTQALEMKLIIKPSPDSEPSSQLFSIQRGILDSYIISLDGGITLTLALEHPEDAAPVKTEISN